MRHVAWDVAYLAVPWPSCWCAWRLPADVAAGAVQRWRSVAGTEVGDGVLDVAAAAWAFVSVSWFVARARGDDPAPADPALRGLVPSRRAMLQHRLSGVVERDRPTCPA